MKHDAETRIALDKLKLAAMAIGQTIYESPAYAGYFVPQLGDAYGARFWNPFDNNGDALWLNSKLKGKIEYHDGGVSVYVEGNDQGYFVDIDIDAAASTRFAIVLAAVEYGTRIKVNKIKELEDDSECDMIEPQ